MSHTNYSLRWSLTKITSSWATIQFHARVSAMIKANAAVRLFCMCYTANVIWLPRKKWHCFLDRKSSYVVVLDKKYKLAAPKWTIHSTIPVLWLVRDAWSRFKRLSESERYTLQVETGELSIGLLFLRPSHIDHVWSYDRGNIVGWVFHRTRWLVRFSHLNTPFLQTSEFI